MDGIAEKKWFVYIGDHHEGPFSVGEVQEKMAQGLVATTSFVWAEGMADWVAMTEVAELAGLLSAQAESSPPVDLDSGADMGDDLLSIGSAPPVEENPPSEGKHSITSQPLHDTDSTSMAVSVPQQSSSPAASTPAQAISIKVSSKNDEKTDEIDRKELEKAQSIGAMGVMGQSVQTKKKISKEFIFTLLAVVMFGGLTIAYLQGYLDPLMKSPIVRTNLSRISASIRPYAMKASQKFPRIEDWISPIPDLEDTSPEDYAVLNAAAKNQEGVDPRIGVALSRENPLVPAFYVSARALDGTRFKLYLLGVPETLVNHLDFQTQTAVILKDRLGKSAPIYAPNGKPIPKGEYRVYVSVTSAEAAAVGSPAAEFMTRAQKIAVAPPSDIPKDSIVLSFKTFFLGGPKDPAYVAKLKDYHEKLRLKAGDELKEISQFLNTLGSQFESTTSKFALLKKVKINPKQKQAWEAFHKEWIKLESQLDQIFQKWSPELANGQYFYDMLYQMTQQLGQDVTKVHDLQTAYLTGKGGDLKTAEIQVGQAAAAAQGTISLLKTKIEQAQALPPTPNGMPRKDGL